MGMDNTVCISEIRKILNILSQSTNDFYFYYDFQKNLIYLSDNIYKAQEVFCINKTVCTLEEWRQGVVSYEIHRLVKTMDDLISKKTDTYNLNYRVKNAKGHNCWINSCGKLFCGKEGQPIYVLGRLSYSNQLAQTGNYSNKELKKEIKKILDTLQPGYLLLIGVDNLKRINLKNGRDFGDAVLNDVANIVADETEHKHKVYRINGDWFAVNIPLISESGVKKVFENIQERLAGQCTISGGSVSYTDYYVADEHILLQYAESSLEYSKTHGKKILTFFLPENYEKKLRELELSEEMKKNIENHFEGFQLYFQPQVHAETYTLYGAESLLRYHSSRYGDVSPLEFIPILEQGEMIYEVGLWVIKEALKYCRKWREVFPLFHISVNMSFQQLEHNSIEDDVLDIVKGSGVPGNALTIEVTESMQISNYPQLNSFFERWNKSGIEISVDDFGTGYSSLSRLKEMSVDEIKIDRCFIRQIQNSAYNFRLLSNIIELADSSQIRVCCEGVETVEELEVLNGLHPALLQGFLFAKPCSAQEFEEKFVLSEKGIEKNFVNESKSAKKNDFTYYASADELAKLILDAEDDIVYLADLDTYELYYLNPAGQKIFGTKDYAGKKCYKVLQGKDSPCEFCSNELLCRDSFYMWETRNEYCGRHFLLKDKMISYKGKNTRLEIAHDITKKEYVSQIAKERLLFAEKILDYIKTLSANSNFDETVNKVLASLGDFYQADRAYLFEYDSGQPGGWSNTFEWCAVNVSPQIDNLQNIPSEIITRWIELFEKDQSIMIYNVSGLQEISPDEWKILSDQGIQRLIAVPIRDNKKTIGFVGIDNPRYCIHDDSQVRVLACFLLICFRQEKNECRYQALLQESNNDLLSALNVGFWTMNINKNHHTYGMTINDTMKQQLDVPEGLSAQACFHFWASRIRKDYQKFVEREIKKMISTGKIVQFVFLWEHTKEGEMALRFTGVLIEDNDLGIKLKGYCKIMKYDKQLSEDIQ